MNFTIRRLLLIFLIISIIFAMIATRYRPVRIAVGMKRETVHALADSLGAMDSWKHRSVYIVQVPVDGGEPPKPYVPGHLETNEWDFSGFTVQVSFDEDVLKEILLWDWRGRDDTVFVKDGPDDEEIEHVQVSEFRVSRLGNGFSYDKIKTINVGVFPPNQNTN